jgi:hypothetical protein
MNKLTLEELQSSIVSDKMVAEETVPYCPSGNANDFGRGVIKMPYGWVSCDFYNGVAHLDKHPQAPEGCEVAIYHNQNVKREDVRFFLGSMS